MPYTDAWNMPIPLALEFVTVATERQKSNAKSNQNNATMPQVDVVTSETGATKLIATRRKSKQVKDEQ
nr:hypothetical protein [Moraxella sp. CTOTU48717]